MKKRRIILYDTSVIIGAVGTSLQQSPQFEVIPLLPEQKNGLEAMEPDVILFDLEAAHPEAAFAMLEKQSDMTLIGISPDSNLVKVWSGRQLKEISTQELIEVIDHS